MRNTVRCKKCNETLQLGWQGCPRCLSIVSESSISVDDLRKMIVKDIETFSTKQDYQQCIDFFVSGVQDCLTDWQWAQSLGWPEGDWLLGRCHNHRAFPQPSIDFWEWERICGKKAIDYFKVAASKGFLLAEYDLGRCTHGEEGFRWAEKAASRGHLGAKYELARRFKEGDGVPKDEAKGKQLHLQIAAMGYSPAQVDLGTQIWTGKEGQPRDLASAFKWFATAAESGSGDGMFYLACLYYNGEGVKKDKQIAKRWIHASAERNNTNAKRFIEVEDEKMFPWGF
jgi:TPR repeat protein